MSGPILMGILPPGTAALPPNIIFVGDSLTNGTGSQPFNNFPYSNDYPSRVAGSLQSSGLYVNAGVGGQTAYAMLADAVTVVDPFFNDAYNNVVCFHGGTNDIFYGANDITTYARIVSYCQQRQANGWKVIVGTITPRSDPGVPANQDTYRLSVNAMIRANWRTFADGIADIGADPNMGILGDETNTQYYNGDLVHHNPNGYRVLAGYFLAALARIGITGHVHGDKAGLVSDMWLPASMFGVIAGAPALTELGNKAPTWALHHGAIDGIACQALMPQDWQAWNTDLVWTNTLDTAGNAAVYLQYQQLAEGGGLLSGAVTMGTQLLASPPGYDIVYTQLASLNSDQAGSPSRTLTNLIVVRNGSSGSDTMTGDTVNVLGVYLSRSK